MKIYTIGLAVTASAAAFGQLNETFSYSNGPLGTVSGGAWVPWSSSSGDATVSNGVAVIDDSADVVRTFGSLLTGNGAINYSFQLNLSQLGSDDMYYVYFAPSTAPHDTGFDYDEAFGFGFDESASGDMRIFPGTGSSNVAATLVQGLNTISGTLTRVGDTMSYTAFLNGAAIGTGSFAFTDTRGINAVEFYQGSGNPSANAFATIDNITIAPVPEPATLAALGLGAAALIRRRRRA